MATGILAPLDTDKGITAPFDTDGGATFRRDCALRGISAQYFIQRGILSKNTVTKLKFGRPISGYIRRRVVAVLDAVPIDPSLVPPELREVG